MQRCNNINVLLFIVIVISLSAACRGEFADAGSQAGDEARPAPAANPALHRVQRDLHHARSPLHDLHVSRPSSSLASLCPVA